MIGTLLPRSCPRNGHAGADRMVVPYAQISILALGEDCKWRSATRDEAFSFCGHLQRKPHPTANITAWPISLDRSPARPGSDVWLNAASGSSVRRQIRASTTIGVVRASRPPDGSRTPSAAQTSDALGGVRPPELRLRRRAATGAPPSQPRQSGAAGAEVGIDRISWP
jgi:hypothetical protein